MKRFIYARQAAGAISLFSSKTCAERSISEISRARRFRRRGGPEHNADQAVRLRGRGVGRHLRRRMGAGRRPNRHVGFKPAGRGHRQEARTGAADVAGPAGRAGRRGHRPDDQERRIRRCHPVPADHRARASTSARRTAPSTTSRCRCQGSRTEDVLWLVDGVRINNRLYAGTTPLDTLPASHDRPHRGARWPARRCSTAPRASPARSTSSPRILLRHARRRGHVRRRHQRQLSRRWLLPRLASASNHFVLYASDDQSRGFRPFRSADFQPSGTQRDRAYDICAVGGKYAVRLHGRRCA